MAAPDCRAEQRVAVRVRLYKGTLDLPKSDAGRREVPITGALARDLVAWRMASAYSQKADLVFPTPLGTHQLYPNLLRRMLKPAARAAALVDADGVPWPALHALRHTAASRWFRAGMETPVVSRILGHTDPAFTFKTYVHLLPADLPNMDDYLSRSAHR